MTNLVEDIVDFVRGNRVPVSRREVVVEIIQLAQHNPAWPRVGPDQWESAIDQAVKDGLLVDVAGMVSVKPEPVRVKEVQLDLF